MVSLYMLFAIAHALVFSGEKKSFLEKKYFKNKFYYFSWEPNRGEKSELRKKLAKFTSQWPQ